MRKGLWLGMLLLVVVLILPTACKAPAEFEVISLDIAPPQVTAGETVSVTAEVRNTGGSEGVYTATLTVDGEKVETKEVTIAPSASKTVTFSLVKDTPGTYQVGIGGLSSSLTVKQKLVAKEFELKYDDGQARDAIGTIPPYFGGYVVDFSPPATPFTIKKVRIAGGIYAKGLENKTFDVEIWDKDQKVLHRATYPYTKFPMLAGEHVVVWAEFEVPNIEVSDKFYVHIYTDSPYPGLQIGADDNVINEHSEFTIRDGGLTRIVDPWPCERDWGWFGDKSKVNWMIRVVGTSMVPQE